MTTLTHARGDQAADSLRRSKIFEYDALRAQLQELWSAPVRDMHAIDEVLKRLDETHAAFKSLHGRDQQRY